MPSPTPPPIDAHTLTLIQLAIHEDLYSPTDAILHGDKTVELSIPSHQQSTATIVARKPGIIAGTYLLNPILQHYHPNMQFPITNDQFPISNFQITILTPDGSPVTPNQPIATITAPTRTLLSAERVLLNFLSHLSGIASLTHQYVAAVTHLRSTSQGAAPVITDTRKTTPGFRVLDKYAVRCGGGVNHRQGLYDGVMLKDNHLAALKNQLGVGGKNLTLAQLTAQIRQQLDPAITLWLEVDTLDQFAEALPLGGADIILLDNFTPTQLQQAVQLRNQSKIASRPLLEASGGITLQNLAQIAATGIDRIAIGALTHSASILDVSMELT